MKHYYDTDGHEFQTPPDPFHGRSPMHDADGSYKDEAFVEMGGRIEDDGQPTPEEKFFTDLNAYLVELEAEAQKMGLDISIDDFKTAAATMMSSDLIAWAKSQGVPDAMVELVRGRILAFVADASRIGLTWTDIFPA